MEAAQPSRGLSRSRARGRGREAGPPPRDRPGQGVGILRRWGRRECEGQPRCVPVTLCYTFMAKTGLLGVGPRGAWRRGFEGELRGGGCVGQRARNCGQSSVVARGSGEPRGSVYTSAGRRARSLPVRAGARRGPRGSRCGAVVGADSARSGEEVAVRRRPAPGAPFSGVEREECWSAEVQGGRGAAVGGTV